MYKKFEIPKLRKPDPRCIADMADNEVVSTRPDPNGGHPTGFVSRKKLIAIGERLGMTVDLDGKTAEFRCRLCHDGVHPGGKSFVPCDGAIHDEYYDNEVRNISSVDRLTESEREERDMLVHGRIKPHTRTGARDGQGDIQDDKAWPKEWPDGSQGGYAN